MTAAWAAGSVLASDDPLLFYRDGGRVVFTNTPSRPDARPVPGLPRAGGAAGHTQLPATRYDDYIELAASETGLPVSLIKSVALVESGFDPQALSPKGAQGLMQLMPATARRYGVRDAFDPLQNLRAGARHLRDLMEEFGGDLTLALAAYNAGSAAVRRHGGVPAYRETRAYVRRVQETLERRSRRPPPPPPAAAGPLDPVRVVVGNDGSLLLVN